MKLRSLLACALLCAASPAAAVTVIATYTGIVYNSFDQKNIFGTGSTKPDGSANLDGLAIIASFTFDSEIGIRDEIDTSRALSGQFTDNPFTAASVTINGHTEDMGSYLTHNHPVVDAEDLGIINQWDEFLGYLGQYPSGYDEVEHYQYNYEYFHRGFDQLNAIVFSVANNIVNTTDYTSPLVYTVQPGDTAYGYFKTYTDRGATNNAWGDFTITSVTIAQAGAIPEPATWALMIVGFGAIGATMRAARRKTVSFAA